MLLLRDVRDRYLGYSKNITVLLVYLFVIMQRSQDLNIWNIDRMCPYFLVSNYQAIFTQRDKFQFCGSEDRQKNSKF